MPIFNTWASQQDPLSLSLLDRLLNQYIQKSDAPAAYLMRGDPQGLWKDLNTPKPVNMTQDMTDVALNANPIMGLIGATAYHGSPAIFDKFDINKLGSGEGAQVYGHGMYFAENPKVAQHYSEIQPSMGSYPSMRRSINGVEVDVGSPEAHAATLLKANNLSISQAKNLVKSWINNPNEMYANESVINGWKKTLDTLNTIKKKSDVKDIGTGNLYKVDIPDEFIPKMLDWHKPLSEQTPEVQKALSNLPHRGNEWTFQNTLETLNAAPHTKEISGMNPTGQEIYSLLGNDMMVGNKAKGQKYASELLNKQGISGIKYLDSGSRGKGGTHNFVVFDPTQVKILERNNKGLLGD